MTNQKVLIFAPEQWTLSCLSDELTKRGCLVEWLPAESWHHDVFENTGLVVLDLVDWSFENRDCVRALCSHLVSRQDRFFPVVVLTRPDVSDSCVCGSNPFRILQHRTNNFLDMDDLAVLGKDCQDFTDLLFELTSSSIQEDWKKAERILLQLAVHGARIPGCDEAVRALEQHGRELGHKPRIRFVESTLVDCGTI